MPHARPAAVVAAADGPFEAANGVTLLPHLTLQGVAGAGAAVMRPTTVLTIRVANTY